MSQHDALAPENKNERFTKRLLAPFGSRMMTQIQQKDAVNGGPGGKKSARALI